MVDLSVYSDESLSVAFEPLVNAPESSRLETVLDRLHAISVDVSAVAQATLDAVYSIELSE
jgi:hypothetical protein